MMDKYLIVIGIVVGLLAMPVWGQSVESAAPSGPPTVFDAPGLVKSYQASIRPSELSAQLYFFASDLFEGRETTTRGQKLAAEYLAARYREMGLTPMGDAVVRREAGPSAYYQRFDVHGSRLIEARIEVIVQEDTVLRSVFSAGEQDGLSYLSMGNVPAAGGSVVFAG
ncbi:MAG: peptidase M28, partial [Rhodothermales bacterium]